MSAITPLAWVVVALAVFAVAAIIVIVVLARRANARRRTADENSDKQAASSDGNGLTYLAASIATAVSASGMWQFFERVMPGLHWGWRLLMFGFLEVAVITSAVRARGNMREKYSAGVDGMAVWAITCTSAVLSALEALSFAEGLFRLAAPLVAAWLWERGMAIERRRLRGTSGINWRLTPERVLVWLGVAEATDRTAGEVDAQRRLTRVALAAKRARMLRETGAADRRQRRAVLALERAYAAAHTHTGLGRDKTVQEALAAEVASLYSAATLMDLSPASAWQQQPEEGPHGFTRLAEETRRLDEGLALRAEIRESLVELHAQRAEIRESLANLVPLAAYVTGRRVAPSGRQAVAGDDRPRDQTATGPATAPATVIPAPRRRLVGAPGSPWPVGHLVPFEVPSRLVPRLGGDRVLPPSLVAGPVAEPVVNQNLDATDPRPDGDQDRDQKRPSEQDNRAARRFAISRVKAGKGLPSKGEIASRYGWSEGWAWNRIQEAKRELVPEGWIFPEGGLPVAPAAVSAPVPNGSRPHDADAP